MTSSKAGANTADLIRDGMLEELCDSKATALLATPYLAFETRFLAREGNELHLWATMSRSVAENTLSEHALKIRFPWALGMWAGSTKVLGFEQDAKRRYLRVAVPDRLGPDEQRKHWRYDRCFRSLGTLGNSSLKVVRITLDNLSQGGASIFCSEPLDMIAFSPSHQPTLSLHLEGGVHVQGQVRIVHGDALRMGLVFDPPLQDEALDRLNGWMLPRWQEANRAWQDRSELRAQAVQAAAMAVPEGILLITSNPEIEAQLRPLLEGQPELRTAPPVMSGLRHALTPPPRLVLLHLPQSGLEERRRYRALVEALPNCPLILLAAPQGVALAQELATEVKAHNLAWNPGLGAFLRRLVVGLLRKHSSSEKG